MGSNPDRLKIARPPELLGGGSILTVSIFDHAPDTVIDTVKILSFYKIAGEYCGHKKPARPCG